MLARVDPMQLLRYAGLFTWGCMGVPLLWEFFQEGLTGRDLYWWRVSYLTFGACYFLLTRAARRQTQQPYHLLLLAVLTLCAIAVSYFSQTGLGGALLMVVAGLLPWFLPLWLGISWLLLEYAALVPVFSEAGLEPMYASLQAGVLMGYGSFVFITSLMAKRQVEARDEQRRLNAELRATRALLAESSRLNERMRISRELHDLLGHHLTALSLNLEVASHLSQGRAQEHVRQAQSLAKLLLTDVREAVSQLREDDAIDLHDALNRLIEGVPSLQVSLEIAPGLALADPARAQVLLRCAQEIITNAVRHARATRLSLVIAEEGDGIGIRARDDGCGADEFEAGNGLRGMRERLAQYGGRLDINTARNKGFALEIWLPLEHSR